VVVAIRVGSAAENFRRGYGGRGCGEVLLGGGEVITAHRQLAVGSRVEVVELVDPVQDIADKFLQIRAGRPA
jgi:hypothetical protein